MIQNQITNDDNQTCNRSYMDVGSSRCDFRLWLRDGFAAVHEAPYSCHEIKASNLDLENGSVHRCIRRIRCDGRSQTSCGPNQHAEPSKKKLQRSRQVDPTQLARREDIFRLYRDMGPTRNYDRLVAAIEAKHGSISKRTLANWSQKHSWQERVAEYDRDLTKGAQVQVEALDPNFDRRDA